MKSSPVSLRIRERGKGSDTIPTITLLIGVKMGCFHLLRTAGSADSPVQPFEGLQVLRRLKRLQSLLAVIQTPKKFENHCNNAQ